MPGTGSHVSLMGLIAVFGLSLAAFSAQAMDISEIPSSLADGLNISETAAEMVLTAMVLLSCGLALSMLPGSNMALVSIVELGALGMLTAIGWVDGWLIVMVALVLALIFGSKLRDWGETTFKSRE